ncbi:MAG: non-canonical purine NTP pyrophosphatase [Thermoplasmata archaeon]|nr:non-canonical purine NTP pyrophosphatase [Thermoplasmata archaeon]
MRVTFVTSNASKVAEVRRIFAEYEIPVAWSRRSIPEPQCDRLEEVVEAKLAAAAKPGVGVVVEDSGLFLEDAKGFPGVYSRFAYDTIGLDGVLRLLANRPRGATFRTVAGFRKGRTTLLTVGEVHGTISSRRQGTGGFGYDPIFFPEGSDRTFAEISGPEKDRISHRGRAMRALARKIAALNSKV